MIKPEMVPKESLVAYQRAFKIGGGPADGIAAALNAWPGMRVDDTFRWLSDVAIILPMEDKNAES